MTDTEQKAREISAKKFWKECGYDMGATKAMLKFSEMESESLRQQMVALEQQIADKVAEIERLMASNSVQVKQYDELLLINCNQAIEIKSLQSRVKELEDKYGNAKEYIAVCAKANKHSCVFYD